MADLPAEIRAPASVAETLRRARALIEDPKRWTQRAFARRRPGARTWIDPQDAEAGCWCALGALLWTNGPFTYQAEKTLQNVTWPKSIGAFNDTNSHSDVLVAFDKAIALAEAAS